MNVTVETKNLLRRYRKGDRVYSLFCAGADSADFRIEICEGSECENGNIRVAFAEAVILFEKIANSDTPPYILPEILADFVVERG